MATWIQNCQICNDGLCIRMEELKKTNLNPRNERLQALKGPFLDLLTQDTERYSRRELARGKRGKHIADEMKEMFSDFIRGHDVNLLIEHLVADGSLIETMQVKDQGRPKMVLKPWGE